MSESRTVSGRTVPVRSWFLRTLGAQLRGTHVSREGTTTAHAP